MFDFFTTILLMIVDLAVIIAIACLIYKPITKLIPSKFLQTTKGASDFVAVICFIAGGFVVEGIWAMLNGAYAGYPWFDTLKYWRDYRRYFNYM